MYFGKTKHYILPLLLAFSLGNLNAQHNRNLSTHLHSKQHQDLIAGQQNIHKEINLVDSIALLEMLEEEEEEFPGIDIYGENWDQTWVNPYKVPIDKLPESATIDVSEYAHHWSYYIELRLATQTHAQRSGFVASYRRYSTCGLLRESEINTI